MPIATATSSTGDSTSRASEAKIEVHRGLEDQLRSPEDGFLHVHQRETGHWPDVNPRTGDVSQRGDERQPHAGTLELPSERPDLFGSERLR